MLAADDILENCVVVWPESEYDKRFSENRVLCLERQDAHGHVRPVRVVQEAHELIMHDLVRADPAMQDRLVEHDRQLHDGFASHQALTLHPHLYKALDHRWRNWLDLGIAADDMSRISLGLK